MSAWKRWGLGLPLAVILLGLLGLLNARRHQAARREQSYMQWRCMTHLKQLALGMLMFAKDHNDALPSSATWHSDILPYVKNPALFTCPCGTVYTMNPGVSEVKLSDIKDIKRPSKTVLIYECDEEGRPAFVHYGGTNVAYVDGRVKWIKPEEVAELVWDP